jgi:hypothetical protein
MANPKQANPTQANPTQAIPFLQGLSGRIALTAAFAGVLLAGFWPGILRGQAATSGQAAGSTSSGQASQTTTAQAPGGQNDPAAPLARGKKLYLKGGDFQLVREYQVEGNRVRFYSVERSQWEEIPADMVDWDATKRAEATETQQDAALLSKIHSEEAARKAVVVDVDASVEVAPNVFLPDGEGMFVLDGKSVSTLSQADTDYKFNKTQLVKQILIPIPIIPTRHTVYIAGARASFRINNKEVEFYRRSKDPTEPDIYLIHAKVKGDRRQIENLDMLFQMQTAKRDSVPIEKWELVKGVYRLTLGQALAPGEYALAEVVKGASQFPGQSTEQSLYVWDFGVDAGAGTGMAKATSKTASK